MSRFPHPAALSSVLYHQLIRELGNLDLSCEERWWVCSRTLEFNADRGTNSARDNVLHYLIVQPHALGLEPLTKVLLLRYDVSYGENLRQEQSLEPPG